MERLTERIDELFAQNKGQEAEALLKGCLEKALQEGRVEEAVPILNELIGYCRETSQTQRSYEYAELVLRILDMLQLKGTLPYATTLLNIANAYRAGGRLEDSLRNYEKVEEIYSGKLQQDDMLFASLYNNISLLYQEMEDFEAAKKALEKALVIVEGKEDTFFEVAVTYANLAATDLRLGMDEEAERCFQKAIALFENHHISDTHYYAAISSLATFHYQKGDYREAEQLFLKAMQGIEAHLGQNEYYHRMKENAQLCRQAYEKYEEKMTGLSLCREYYEAYGRPMLQQLFPEYIDRIAVGLVGEGSDCFGCDDEISRDHDWGPGFCLWLTDETYGKIGEALQQAYEALPREYKGYVFQTSVHGQGRRGVNTIRGFYERILGKDMLPDEKDLLLESKGEAFVQEIKWESIGDTALAAAVNGEVFHDPEGIFSGVRKVLQTQYPQRLRYLKLAEAMALFCQNGQYNVPRVLARGDSATAVLLRSNGVKEGLKILYYIEETYPLHDKWLLQGLKRLGKYREILQPLEQSLLVPIEETGEYLTDAAEKIVRLLYREGYISHMDNYLDIHVGELLLKAELADLTVEELAHKVTKLEFEAFDKVKNKGGRAECQDDWFTFSVMRKSQYLTWNRTMLMQYCYDFTVSLKNGRNLIEEKYGRMMESTAPGEYERIREHFPDISSEKKEIIEAIVEMQVNWMEEFAQAYPCLAGNARSIHTYEDTVWNTSYETYLRGEISTYSDRMLELYGRYLVELARAGENPAKRIMEHSVIMYGYESLEDAEAALERSK